MLSSTGPYSLSLGHLCRPLRRWRRVLPHTVAHPTINLDEPEPGFDLDFVPHVARPYDIGIGISNAFGFGGLNACVVVGRAP